MGSDKLRLSRRSSSRGLKGSESDQREAVGYFFDFLEQAPDRLEFMNWFNLHDGRDQDCQKIARSFTRKGDALDKNKNLMNLFSDFSTCVELLC